MHVLVPQSQLAVQLCAGHSMTVCASVPLQERGEGLASGGSGGGSRRFLDNKLYALAQQVCCWPRFAACCSTTCSLAIQCSLSYAYLRTELCINVMLVMLPALAV